jgi:hypothetical protein
LISKASYKANPDLGNGHIFFKIGEPRGQAAQKTAWKPENAANFKMSKVGQGILHNIMGPGAFKQLAGPCFCHMKRSVISADELCCLAQTWPLFSLPHINSPGLATGIFKRSTVSSRHIGISRHCDLKSCEIS